MALIQKEIMAYGPVTAVFDVYGDFYQYNSGIYIVFSTLRFSNHRVFSTLEDPTMAAIV